MTSLSRPIQAKLHSHAPAEESEEFDVPAAAVVTESVEVKSSPPQPYVAIRDFKAQVGGIVEFPQGAVIHESHMIQILMSQGCPIVPADLASKYQTCPSCTYQFPGK